MACKAIKEDIETFITTAGYDYVDEDKISEALHDSIAMAPLVDPREMACGHLFSLETITADMRRQAQQNNRVECPLCRHLLSGTVMRIPNRAILTLLDALVVYCPTKDEHGCDWQGPREEVASHMLRDCGSVLVTCKLGGVPHELARKDIKNCPFARVLCEYCKGDYRRGELDTEDGNHALICDLWPVNCKHCGLPITRREKAGHEDRCEEKPIAHERDCSFVAAAPWVRGHLDDMVKTGLIGADIVHSDAYKHAVAKTIAGAIREERQHSDELRAEFAAHLEREEYLTPATSRRSSSSAFSFSTRPFRTSTSLHFDDHISNSSAFRAFADRLSVRFSLKPERKARD